MTAYLCAVDVGTLSARAGVFDTAGRMLSRAVAEIIVHDAPGQRAEYASDQIWQAVCAATRDAVAQAGVDPTTIRALGFDATCSLVLRDRDGAPLALGPDGRDTIAWYDHRAHDEALICTATGHRLIDHLGGAMSPEMQTPKLLWLKRHRPDLWSQLGSARDLADHLTSRATGSPAASACSLATKWPYLPEHGGWQRDFLAQIGLDDLTDRAALPDHAIAVGQAIGGLTAQAAADLGLAPGTPVAAGMIDAYAGALGTLGLKPDTAPEQRLTLIAGTSNCIMAITTRPLFARGIWGPSLGTVLPGHWTSEGGQSAAGAALDYVLDSWPLTELDARPDHNEVLGRIGVLLAEHGPALGREIDVLPDFNGNRSPLSDATARAVISGLGLERSFDALCTLYWRTAVALALGVRQIIEHLNGPDPAGNRPAETLAIAGGLARTTILKQLFADVTGLKILRSEAEDTVLLGTAIAASVAGGVQPDLASAARAMTELATVLSPDPARRAAFDRDYAVMLRLQAQRAELAALKAQR
ncbi:FGGY-family carbohydrate kinase [Pararhodobacter zhoushanensis]|uniref:FGGY-family carbohydrate kinase n=1 Tax=Pararhodobacter zhoushanensis TaxID=2479545 RepID=UPI000F8C4BE2|nr:FGGY family pentulose kinase [Pararhodobacter zhoushanensis]